jgi:agmatine deiminase
MRVASKTAVRYFAPTPVFHAPSAPPFAAHPRGLPFLPETPPHRFPAEWEPHAALWLGWHETARRDSVLAAMIRALQPHVPVKVLYRTDSMRPAGNSFLLRLDVDTARVRWVQNPHYSFWMRDPGPLFRETPAGGMQVANFRWTEYGGPMLPEDMAPVKTDSLHGLGDDLLARHLGFPLVSTTYAAEGGGLETNGQGLLMTIEETALQRNPGKWLADIERESTG